MEFSDRKLRLCQYSGMAVSFLALPFSVSADVVYTNVDPDRSVTDGVFEVDFDGDGKPEFNIYHYKYDEEGSLSRSVYISATGFAGSIIVQTSSQVKVLQKNAIIGPEANFSSMSAYMGVFYSDDYKKSSYGNWNGVSERFVGVRFKLGSDYYYGWIRLDVGKDYTSVTVRDYAFENEPNVPIVAGKKK